MRLSISITKPITMQLYSCSMRDSNLDLQLTLCLNIFCRSHHGWCTFYSWNTKKNLSFNSLLTNPQIIKELYSLKFYTCNVNNIKRKRIIVPIRWHLCNLKNTHIDDHRSVPRQPYIRAPMYAHSDRKMVHTSELRCSNMHSDE